MKKSIIVIAALVIGGVSLILFSSPSSTVSLLSGSDFVSTYQKTSDAILLDVRTPSEFLSGHIDEAQNVDFQNSNFNAELQKLDKEKPYFVYCRSGNRSGQAITLMKNEGFKRIYDLQGGIVSNQNSLKLVTNTGVTNP